MNKSMMWGFVVVALVVGMLAGYLFERSRATTNMEAAKMVMEKQVQDIQMKLDQLEKEKAMMQVTPSVSPEPSGVMIKK